MAPVIGVVVLWAALIPLAVGVTLIWRRCEWFGLIGLFMAFGMFWGYVRMPAQAPQRLDGTHGVLVGRIVAVTESVNRDVFTLDKCQYKCGDTVYNLANVRVRLTVIGESERLIAGDWIRAEGSMSTAGHDVPDVRNAPVGDRLQIADGIGARMFCRERCTYLGVNELSWWEKLCIDLHDGLRDAVTDAGFAPETADFVRSIVAGDSESLDSGTRADFRDVGLAHILALSGMHVGIIAALAAALLIGLRAVARLRGLYYVSLAVLVLLYAVAVGVTPSVTRAATMFVIFTIGAWMQTRVSAYNALAVTVSVWLLIKPEWLWSPGLQLSCLAVLGLCVLYTRLGKWKPANPVLSWILLWVAVPVVAVIATSLLTVVYFHSLPVWFLPVNMAAALLVAPLVAVAAITMILSAIGLPAACPAAICDGMYNVLEQVVRTFRNISVTQLDGIYLSGWQILGWGMCLFCIFWLMARPGRRQLLFLLVSAIFFTVATIAKPSQPLMEVYVPRLSAGTNLIVAYGDTVLSVPLNDFDNDAYLRRHCSGLVAERGADSLLKVPSQFDSPAFIRRGNMMWLSDRTILAVNKPADLLGARVTHLNYLLFTDSYRVGGRDLNGQREYSRIIERTIDTVCVDTVLLSYGLPPSTRRHIVSRLDSMAVPYIDLHKDNWQLVFRRPRRQP